MKNSDGDVMSAAEYADSVNQWLHQAYTWQIIAMGFPSYVAYQSNLQRLQQQPEPHQPASTLPPVADTAREFFIPPIWKRLVAEFVDFMFLFVIKFVVTYVAADTLEILDFDNFMKNYDSSLYAILSGEDIEVKTALELTSDIVLLEFVHRVVVCVYETVCTFRGPPGTCGGATPGKLFMGLRIYKCEEISLTANPRCIRIKPASDLGVFWATIRSFLKNMSMVFLFPVCATFLFLPFNRTVYDVMSKSIVLEAPVTTGGQERR